MAVVWQISAVHFGGKTLLSGVLLNRSPFPFDRKLSPLKHLLKVAKTYGIGVYADRQIEISTVGRTIRTRTDNSGGFAQVVDFQAGKDIVVTGEDGKPIEIVQDFPVVFENTDSPFDIISDIDDTIIHSFTADFFKRIKTLALTSPQKRKVVDFTRKLFAESERLHARVFYISKSESNLFALLAAFIDYNGLPRGRLFLTPYLRFSQLLRPKKGRAYKLKHIRFILDNSAEKPFVLVGDDSQKDMEIYTAVVSEYPGRIKQIFIRKTKSVQRKKQKQQWKKLKQACPSAVYFSDGDEMKDFDTW